MPHSSGQPQRPAAPSRAHFMPDGSMLCTAEPKSARELRVGWWVEVEGEPWRITDMRSTGDHGRVVHLAGRRPLTLTSTGTVPVYRVQAPPVRGARAGADSGIRRA
ncbi:hypothetical protein P1P68_06065 [Streptomyces scabiei]|uniref:hypothetical protein n=1 Tax=Streptomyces scabiei TaxID=1930 RepID=UPI0029905F64|nr:hypothetical protein [Streptomyces scabiei]MDW8804368.1 hypothetical protein [Streptomyces scabiei]